MGGNAAISRLRRLQSASAKHQPKKKSAYMYTGHRHARSDPFECGLDSKRASLFMMFFLRLFIHCALHVVAISK